ncbi:MAG: class I SAM-dependent rRNA methyltransferase [Planctomycetaceae bacterium]
MPTLPKVILKPRRAEPFFNRHPWVFGGAVERIEGAPEPGAEVDVFSGEGEFIARGLFNPHSQIRVRLYAWNSETRLDRDFWSTQLDRAIAMRRALFADAGPDAAYRLVYSESDGLSGLIVDRYGDWLLVQFTSLALAGHRETLVELLEQKLQPAGIWLRTEKGIRESESLDMADGLIAGKEPPRPLFIEEDGMRFGVDVVEGQKTGFYLDQRDNRAAVAQLVRGHRVLDLFCHTGAFGLTALKRGGAKDVLGVDVSEPGLTMARANADLNDVATKIRFENAKVFDALERLAAAGEKFDTVILDPPKMTRHRAGLNKALRGYFSLNRMALDVLGPGGLLVTCSCSGLVSRDDFESVLAKVSLQANRPLQILAARGQAPDHPVSVHCLETSYLKCYLCRVAT